MKRSLLILALGLAYLPFYAQECPELDCLSGLIATISQDDLGDCSVTVFASDLVANDLSTCPVPVSFAIYRLSEVSETDFVPEFVTATESITITEVDYEQGMTINLAVFIRDGDQFIQSCETYLFLERDVHCTPLEEDCFLSGVIATENGERVNQVAVEFIGTENSTLSTISNGQFSLVSTPCQDPFQLIPSKDGSDLNGISTFDIVLITRHILGINLLDSPYKMIAADVNQSGSISVLDIVKMRRLILGLSQEFEESPSWRFVDADYDFPNPTNPWQEVFPEMISADFSVDSSPSLSFIAIKIGDINGTASTQ